MLLNSQDNLTHKISRAIYPCCTGQGLEMTINQRFPKKIIG
jgi:hypothetical protein